MQVENIQAYGSSYCAPDDGRRAPAVQHKPHQRWTSASGHLRACSGVSVLCTCRLCQPIHPPSSACVFICRCVQSRVLRVLPPAEAEHALLEVLSTVPPFEVLPRTAKFRAAFRLLDVDLSDGLTVGELKQLLPWIVPQYAQPSGSHQHTRSS